ncbi:hypothetical protein CAC42_4759 [Sphaceloma murrayae]|uniref:Chromatin modification-related protein EAF3 n=1 Tax=Sphaceloma murrayae TaxID=2082308 RepID=A0A2K1QNV7_9PEZI|nr:hypothetical protein CAC42_4759 [Sphaceloma murrayae]
MARRKVTPTDSQRPVKLAQPPPPPSKPTKRAKKTTARAATSKKASCATVKPEVNTDKNPNRWDDWVPQDRLRKFTDENRELAKNLVQEMNAQRKSTASRPSNAASVKKKAAGSDRLGSSARASEELGTSRGTKRGRDGKEVEGTEKEEDYLRRPAIKLHIPDNLKSILVDDWEKVTKDHKLVPLPSKTPVNVFLDDYEDHEKQRRREGSADWDILEEVIAGVREYFNKSLGRILLYRFERPQWQDLHSQINKGAGELSGKQVADVYGVEHLLRLFVSLPDLIAHTNMDSQAVSRLREELFKMVQYANRTIPKYLTEAYENPGDQYIESVR